MGSLRPYGREPAQSDIDHIETAAGWMARLLADDVSEQDRTNCQQWREQDPRHERAWQRMCQVSGKFSLPANAGGTKVLERAHKAVTSRRQFLNLSIFMAAGLTAAWLGASRTRLGGSLLAQYRTGVGETRELTLEDGTRLVLNTDTAVDIDFSARERRIQLHQGEILVATGPESPRRRFSVTTRFGELVALGTEFNVRQNERHIQVSVLEGAVEARPAGSGQIQRVGAGQQARFDSTQADAPQRLQAGATSWRQGKLVAEGMRVADFVEEIARYRPGFTLCDSAVADLTISGVFSLENADRALESLARSLPVELSYRTAYWVKVVPAH
ncbi:FecR domain-containing protein [Vreelandella massiliensis]|uniref:FecR domain-containing protein n=1 Tax=Vreelandella massiliensis TaxID=1816686 RepID=UPI00096A50C6|nr:FecR domain-containing protein [Halomonas massiliensis]